MNPWWYVLIVAGVLIYLGVFFWILCLMADKGKKPPEGVYCGNCCWSYNWKCNNKKSPRYGLETRQHNWCVEREHIQ